MNRNDPKCREERGRFIGRAYRGSSALEMEEEVEVNVPGTVVAQCKRHIWVAERPQQLFGYLGSRSQMRGRLIDMKIDAWLRGEQAFPRSGKDDLYIGSYDTGPPQSALCRC